MPRKQRSDSAAAAIDAANAAASPPIEPPPHVRLRPRDRPFWDAIMLARARSEWVDSDLVLAAQLARVQSDIEHETAQAEVEGTILRTDKGTPVTNPRVLALDALTRRQLTMMRMLKIGAITIDRTDAEKARKVERTARTARKQVMEHGEGLLAT